MSTCVLTSHVSPAWILSMYCQYLLLAAIWLLLVAVINVGQAQFIVEPQSVTQYEGLMVRFDCKYIGQPPYAWCHNGVFIEGATPEGFSYGNGEQSQLNIVALPQYNGSILQCKAVVNLVNNEEYLSKNASLSIYRMKIADAKAINGSHIMISLTDFNITNPTTYCINYTSCSGSNFISCGHKNLTSILEVEEIGECDFSTVTAFPVGPKRNGTPSEPVDVRGIAHKAEFNQEMLTTTALNENEKQLKIEVPMCFGAVNATIVLNNGTIVPCEVDQNFIIFTLETDHLTSATLTVENQHGSTLTYENIKITTFDVVRVREGYHGPYVSLSCECAKNSSSLGAFIRLIPVDSNGSFIPSEPDNTFIPCEMAENVSLSSLYNYTMFVNDLLRPAAQDDVPSPKESPSIVRNVSCSSCTGNTSADHSDSHSSVSVTVTNGSLVVSTELSGVALYGSSPSSPGKVYTGRQGDDANTLLLDFAQHANLSIFVVQWNSWSGSEFNFSNLLADTKSSENNIDQPTPPPKKSDLFGLFALVPILFLVLAIVIGIVVYVRKHRKTKGNLDVTHGSEAPLDKDDKDSADESFELKEPFKYGQQEKDDPNRTAPATNISREKIELLSVEVSGDQKHFPSENKSDTCT